MKIDLALHSFCLLHHFRHQPGFDAISFIDLAEALGFSGVNLSLNDQTFRHLGGREEARMDAVRERLKRSGMSLEIDTSGTEPNHLAELLGVAHRMGAGALRLYTRHGGGIAEMMKLTTIDLLSVSPLAESYGIVLVLENHEDFTGPELAAIVEAVASPAVKILFDYGNAQMVLEDPVAALEATLAHIHSVHVKDHVMVRAEDSPTHRLTVAGVPMGEGALPIEAITRRLLHQGLRRLTFESVWAYAAPVAQGRQPLDGVRLGEGAFGYASPPFDPRFLILDTSQHAPDELVKLEREALDKGVRWFRGLLEGLGVTEYGAG